MTMSIRQRPVRAAALADVSVFDTDFFDDSFDDDADQHSGHSTRTPSPAPSQSSYGRKRRSPKRKASDDDSDDDMDAGVDAVTAKRLKRMQRNRVSAASSRERKRQHIENLEGKVKELSAELEELRQENEQLRKTYGAAAAFDAPPVVPIADPASLDLGSFLGHMTCGGFDGVEVLADPALCSTPRIARAG